MTTFFECLLEIEPHLIAAADANADALRACVGAERDRFIRGLIAEADFFAALFVDGTIYTTPVSGERELREFIAAKADGVPFKLEAIWVSPQEAGALQRRYAASHLRVAVHNEVKAESLTP